MLSIRRLNSLLASRSDQTLSFVEVLEGRQFFSIDSPADVDPLPPIGPLPEDGVMYTTTAVTAAADDAHETRVTLDAPARINDYRAVKLTANVTTTDAEAPDATGTVAFFIVGGQDFRGVYAAVSVPDGNGGTTTGYLLGSADLDDAGTATLTVPQLPLGAHEIVAVYLGADAPITAQPIEDLPLRTAQSFPKDLIERPTGLTPISRSVVFDTRGKYFRIAFGRIRTYDAAPASSSHEVPAEGVRLLQEEHNSDETTAETYFKPVDGLVRIDVVAKKVEVDDEGVKRYYYSYEYRLSPASIPGAMTDVNTDFAGSASDAEPTHVVVTTSLKLNKHGVSTFTNPGAITASIVRPKGELLGAAWPTLTPRGAIQTSSAGLKPAATTSAATADAGDLDGDGVDVPELVDRTVVTSGELPPRPMPTGTVIFYDGEERVGKAVLDASGNATLLPKSRSLEQGEHPFRAVYRGDVNYKAFADVNDETVMDQVDVNVTLIKTETSLAFNKTTGLAGDSWQLYADVKTKSPDVVKPTGFVRFYVNEKRVGMIALGSTEKIEYPFVPGTYKLRAVYGGDENSRRSETTELEFTASKSVSWIGMFPPDNAVFLPGDPIKLLTYVGGTQERLVRPTGDGRREEIDGDEITSAPAHTLFEFDFEFEPDKVYRFKGHYDGDENYLPSSSVEFTLTLKNGKVVYKALI